MSVNFAAVHDRQPWRKHRIHQSLHAATDGNDGAKNLLRRIGRVAGMWQKYGPVQCVFVWEDNAQRGYAFRLAVNGNGAVDSARPSVAQILQFDAKKSCKAEEIAECFRADPLDEATAVPTPVAPPDQPSMEKAGLWPDDLPEGQAYFEGLAQQVVVNRYERSLEARAACIAHYGCVCQVCRIDFRVRYGALGAGFIHVHHVLPISSIGGEYRMDPVADLVPVCPNCHAMLHRREPPLAVERLRELLHDG